MYFMQLTIFDRKRNPQQTKYNKRSFQCFFQCCHYCNVDKQGNTDLLIYTLLFKGLFYKKNKSVGTDNIMNEYILTGKTTLISVLCKHFNNILMSGIFPELWVKSIIIPIFKKGDVITIQEITKGFHYFIMSENFLPR